MMKSRCYRPAIADDYNDKLVVVLFNDPSSPKIVFIKVDFPLLVSPNTNILYTSINTLLLPF